MGPGPTSITPDFFLKLANPTAFSPQILTNTIRPCAQLEYLREIRCHSIKKSVWNLAAQGPWTHITLRFLLGNGWSYSLLASVTFKDHCNKFPTQISSRNSQPLLQKLQLKVLKWAKNQDGWPSSSWALHNQFSRNLISERECDVFPRLWCHLMGIPPKIGDSPQFRPISSRKMLNNNQTECNDTCFVQNFD